MTFGEFFSQAPVFGGLMSLAGMCLTALGAWGMKIYLARSEHEIKQEQFSVEALKAQLTGWVDYSAGLTRTIAGQSDLIAAMQGRLNEKDDRIARLEKQRSEQEREITKLWRRIRQMENRHRGEHPDAETFDEC
jgi:septal ring factor EnvC (AmiA/AmiB activator)